MNNEQEKALLEYEELKINEKEIRTRLEELKPIIIDIVPKDAKVNASQGYFELKKRDKWTYGSTIREDEANLKKAKADAIAKGEATNDPTFYVEYRQNK